MSRQRSVDGTETTSDGKVDAGKKDTAAEAPKAKSLAPFDVIGNARTLFNPRKTGFSSLDGFRAFMCLWMMGFHSFIYMHYFSKDLPWRKLGDEPPMYFAVLGYVAVDGFFVLTGFLLAWPLFDEDVKKKAKLKKESDGKVEEGAQKGNESFSVRDWYYRRVIRMVPIYLLALVLHCYVVFPKGHFPIDLIKSEYELGLVAQYFPNATHFPHACDILPLNLLFLNNLIPFGGCMGYTWTMAIQFQFYLILPILWKYAGSGRRLVRILAIILFVGVLTRAFGFWQTAQTKVGTVSSFIFAFFWYTFTFNRIGPIFMGMLGAYLSVYTNLKSWFTRWDVQIVSFGLFALWAWAHVYWSFWVWPDNAITPGMSAVRSYVSFTESVPHWFFHIFILVGGPISGFAFTYLLMIIVNSVGPLGKLLNAIFTHWVWYPVAQLSFFAYLLHPWVLYIQYSTVYYPATPTFWFWAQGCATCVVVTFSISLFMYLLFEKPLDLWLRQGEHPWLSKATFGYCCLLIGVSLASHAVTLPYIMTRSATMDGEVIVTDG